MVDYLDVFNLTRVLHTGEYKLVPPVGPCFKFRKIKEIQGRGYLGKDKNEKRILTFNGIGRSVVLGIGRSVVLCKSNRNICILHISAIIL